MVAKIYAKYILPRGYMFFVRRWSFIFDIRWFETWHILILFAVKIRLLSGSIIRYASWGRKIKLQFYPNEVIRLILYLILTSISKDILLQLTVLNFSIKNNIYSTENIAFYTVASACPLPNKFHKGLLLSSRTSLRVYFIYPLLINGSEFLAFLINELALNIINSSTTTLSTRFVKMCFQ